MENMKTTRGYICVLMFTHMNFRVGICKQWMTFERRSFTWVSSPGLFPDHQRSVEIQLSSVKKHRSPFLPCSGGTFVL